MSKLYHRLSDHRKAIQETYDNGHQRGLLLAWSTFKDCFSVVLGYPILIYGHPFSGKSRLALEIMIQLSDKYGLKHVVGSPETGSPSKVFELLLKMLTGKDLTDQNNNQMTLKEKQEAEIWINEHFILIDVELDEDKNMSFRDFYKRVDLIESELDIKISCTLLDTFDDVEVEWTGARDLVLQKELMYMRKNGNRTGRTHIIVAHMSAVEQATKKIGKDTEIKYWPEPEPQKLIHGLEWYRRSYTMIGVWRPPIHPQWALTDETGTRYTDNSTVIIFGKRKPDEVFAPGDTTKRRHIYYNTREHRYYVKPNSFQVEYAFETRPDPDANMGIDNEIQEF